MTTISRSISGRPLQGEFAPYAKLDIDQVAGDDAVEALASQGKSIVALFGSLDETKVRGLTYEPGKWTLKEVLGHLADDERIFTHRALCIARKDSLLLPGFDEKAYVQFAGFEDRALEDVLDEYRAVRRASIALFSGLTPEAWLRRGIVNDYEASVRGLAFHIAGHELHHLRTLREKYLPRLS